MKKPNYESNLLFKEFMSQLEASLRVQVRPHTFLARVLAVPAPHKLSLYVKMNTSSKVFWGINQNKLAELEQEPSKWLIILVDGRAKVSKIEAAAPSSASIRNVWKIDSDDYYRGISELWKRGGNDGGYKVNGSGLKGIPSYPSVAQLAADLARSASN